MLIKIIPGLIFRHDPSSWRSLLLCGEWIIAAIRELNLKTPHDMFGTLNETQITQLLHQQVIGRLGCHADGLTYVVPVSYAWRDDCIYIYTQEGLKLSMLRTNPRVCFQVDNTRDLSNWQSVICWGEVQELLEDDERASALNILNTRNFPVSISQKMRISNEWPFNAAKIGEIKGVFFRIRLTEKSGRFERTEEPPPLAG